MDWLSSSKVRLALIVNGLYLVSLVVPSVPRDPHHPDAHTFERWDGRTTPVRSTVDFPLSPPSVPGRAQAFESGGQIHVSLSSDMPLLKRRGRTLLFSPSFSAPSSPYERPSSAQFRFILFSDREICPADDCPVSISADGVTVWPEREGDDASSLSKGWDRESVPHTSTKLENGQVVETLAALSLSRAVPYDLFLQIIRAQKVTFRLGPDRVTLNPGQMAALREMHQRLPGPPPDRARSRF